MNFWKNLPTPFFALAPMEDVTDTVFREVILKSASPEKLHVVFTEFLSVDGFLHDTGKDKVKHRLYTSKEERELLKTKGIKLVAQIWGSDPEKYKKTAEIISQNYDFDGIDINMGCPVGKIVKNNACSALIKQPQLAKEIVIATKEGSSMPVSVKTRIGFNHVVTEDWVNHLLEVKPSAITIHGRTQKMMSDGLANWDEIKKAALLKNSSHPDIRIIGNGDVLTHEEGKEKSGQYFTDGIMVGRGIFKTPNFFSENSVLTKSNKIDLLKYHITRFQEEWEGSKNYAILKRFYKIYVNDFKSASSLRAELMRTTNYSETYKIIEKFKKQTKKETEKSVIC